MGRKPNPREHSSQLDSLSDESKRYELKTDAVEDLVQAHAGNAPQYSKEELEKYRKKRWKLPNWLKVLLIKAWFYGAVCFFFLWGLGNYIYALVDMLFILAAALGMATDLLVNNTLRFLEEVPGDNDRWMMFPKKKTSSFFLNIVYFGVILLCVFFAYNIINYVIITATGAVDTIPLGVEPILFGLMCMGFDQLFIGVKHLLRRILEDARTQARRQL